MSHQNANAKFGVKPLIVLIIFMAAFGTSFWAARQIRDNALLEKALAEGLTAYEREDWQEASKSFRTYLRRNPNDIAILRKYAEALMSVRPLDASAIARAVSSYRQIVQLDPHNKAACEMLVALYTGLGDFNELVSVAKARIEHDPNDRRAPLWLAGALVRLNKTEAARQTLQAFIERLDALPDKHLEYVRACVQMSDLPAKDVPQPEAAVGDTDASPPDIALDWLDRAVEYMPDSAEVLVRRARYYRQKAETAGTTEDERSTLMALARKDLDTADTLGPEDPRVQCFLGTEWMAQGEFDRVAAELRVIDNLPQEVLSKHFLDISDWTVARFLLASELATRRGTAAESSALADDTLASLTEKRHRVQVLPSAISLYVAAGKVAEARRCLDEYTTAIETNRPRQANRPFTKFGRDTASSSTKPVGEGGSSRPPYFLYKP